MQNFLRFSAASLALLGLGVGLGSLQAADEDVPPLGPLPEMKIPADQPLTEERVELGKLLFFDPRLSGDGSISCADCHDPKLGWGDGGELSRGYPGTAHWPQTVMNSAYLDAWFWTSSSPTLEKQANSAISGALAGNLKPILAEERMKQTPRYVELFKEVYGTAPTYDGALSAIASYERTIVSEDSPFDNYMNGDESALDEAQLRGMALFEGKANCVACHNGPLMTDQEHYNLGVPPNPAFEEDPQRQIAMRERMRSKEFAEDDFLHLDRDPGRYRATKNMDAHSGHRRFATPSTHCPTCITACSTPSRKSWTSTTRAVAMTPSALRPTKSSRWVSPMTRRLISLPFLMSGPEVIIPRPKLPPYGLLEFPMANQW